MNCDAVCIVFLVEQYNLFNEWIQIYLYGRRAT